MKPPDATATQQFFGSTIFCDDIRSELGKKFSLIGVYQHKILVHAPFPVALPKLGLWITYQEDPREPISAMSLRIYIPGDPDDRASISADIEKPKEDPVPLNAAPDVKRILTFHFTISPFPINQAGKIKVRIVKNGEERKLGTIEVVGGTSTA
ncbi:hypothetical protein [Hyphomicrobium sp. CS1BSMeth3]|uniref:DUF6941 family protein n=1 Tax=Hyphomicrobium sp. CS1BSMeth3 TaxID=1892844 RepID=UPI001160E015|nr:hypothetical protein [Hyphomicrobium sp. CS1BSMeth3]